MTQGSIGRGNRLSPEQQQKFIKVWQAAYSQEEVARAMGFSPKTVSLIAYHMRKNGVMLKGFFAGNRPSDWISLRMLAKSCRRSDPQRVVLLKDPSYRKQAARQAFYIEFIKVWQIAKTLGEVARRFKMTEGRAHALGAMLKHRHGVPLKRFSLKVAYDWPMLIATASGILGELAKGRPAITATRFMAEPHRQRKPARRK